MAPQTTKVNMPGVAEGKLLVGIPTDEDIPPMDRVKAFLGQWSSVEADYQGWGSDSLLPNLHLLSATSKPISQTTFSFTVASKHTNRLGNLHGGCTASLFDICTTTALAPIAAPGYWMFAGVTRTLNVTFLKPVEEGETVIIESEVVSAGKRLCVLKGTLRRGSNGEVLAICEHGKVSVDPVRLKM